MARQLYRMPFGKHRGQSLHQLPEDYLEWLLTIHLSPQLKQGVELALDGEVVYAPTSDDIVDAAKQRQLHIMYERDGGVE